MVKDRIRLLVVTLGIGGVGATAWMKDYQLAPGIVGALLLAAALGLFGTPRGQHK